MRVARPIVQPLPPSFCCREPAHDRAARDPQFRRAPVRRPTAAAPASSPTSTTAARSTYGDLERPLAPFRRRPARPGRSPRGARAAADARLQRVAGRLPRRALRRRRPGRRQHAAHRRRLRVHARAQPRPGGDRLGVARADPAQGDGRGAERGRPRDRRRRRHRLRRRCRSISIRCVERAKPLAAPAATRGDDPAFWLYSSGSTGKPKGTVHTHANAWWTAELYGKGVLG